jgi:hypothetical protein
MMYYLQIKYIYIGEALIKTLGEEVAPGAGGLTAWWAGLTVRGDGAGKP